jgi:hypothetical protein
MEERNCHIIEKKQNINYKTVTVRALASSPIGFVSAAGSVRVPQDLISC